jgi:hypothetical protein
MKSTDFEELICSVRCFRYLSACGNDTRKTMTLYRANLRLSHEIFSVLSVFEVVLRNKIDRHYKRMFNSVIGNDEWLLHASSPGGYLTSHGCGKSLHSVQDALQGLYNGSGYTHDKLVAELMFGFWRFQFGAKEFMAAGSSLHHIFPNRPAGTNHTDIFKKLGFINKIRNRIAHHEPICFGPGNTISTTYAKDHYTTLIEIFQWLGIDSQHLLYGIDKVQSEISFIDGLAI